MSQQIDFPWELEAMRGEPMPEGLPLAEQWAFQAYANLYARYRLKAIEKEAASREKRMIKGEYDDYMRRYRADQKYNRHSVELFMSTEKSRRDFLKAKSPKEMLIAAGKLIEAIDHMRLRQEIWDMIGSYEEHEEENQSPAHSGL